MKTGLGLLFFVLSFPAFSQVTAERDCLAAIHMMRSAAQTNDLLKSIPSSPEIDGVLTKLRSLPPGRVMSHSFQGASARSDMTMMMSQFLALRKPEAEATANAWKKLKNFWRSPGLIISAVAALWAAHEFGFFNRIGFSSWIGPVALSAIVYGAVSAIPFFAKRIRWGRKLQEENPLAFLSYPTADPRRISFELDLPIEVLNEKNTDTALARLFDIQFHAKRDAKQTSVIGLLIAGPDSVQLIIGAPDLDLANPKPKLPLPPELTKPVSGGA